MKKETLIFILYDGIQNSVFESQVVLPLLNKQKEYTNIILISFEKIKPSTTILKERVPPEIQFIALQKYPFVGMWSLFPAIKQLKKLLQKQKSYSLIARGPIAGFIGKKSFDPIQCKTFTIQARGLLAEEYAYAHQNEMNTFKKIIHSLRYKLFQHLEYKVYQVQSPIIIEAVSSAMKEYIMNTFHVEENNVQVADHDIPQLITIEQRATWREQKRTELNIAHGVYVYCYNGSIKPWQCPKQVLTFFEQALQKNKQSYLLILSPDKKNFQKIIDSFQIPKHAYQILTVPHHHIYQYLAACDTGIIFREPHIVNWTARPTKVLEYHAVGLDIIHNNTVEMLQ